MKIRQGFVSNSSSSSFTCVVCGQTYSGWDACLDDAEMYRCLNGHEFCEGHAMDAPELDEDVDTRYEFPIEHCPICQFRYVTDDDLARYLLRKAGLMRGDIALKIKTEFGNYAGFKGYLG